MNTDYIESSNYTDAEDDSDDEWFYKSIQRYEDLLMYELQGSLSQICFQDRYSLLATSCREPLHEILQLMLPDRLTAVKDVGLSKNRDFKLIRAGYLLKKSLMIDIAQNVLISSEVDAINLYSLSHLEKTDVISFKGPLRDNITEASFSIDQGSEPFCISGNSLENIQKHSMISGKHVQDIQFDNFEGNKRSQISFMNVSSQNIFVGIKESGCFLISDDRVGSCIECIKPSNNLQSSWFYNISSDLNFVVCASCDNNFMIFDRRKPDVPCKDLQISNKSIDDGNHVVLNFSPCNRYLSLSGWDKVVKIYDTQNFLTCFVHDGHRAKEVNHLTNHLWHPDIKNTIFSCDDAGFMQIWTFKQ